MLRYRLQVLCSTDSERKQVNAQFNTEEALTIQLNKSIIDAYRPDNGNMSEGDKFERSEKMGDPIRREKRFSDQLTPFGEPDIINDFIYQSKNPFGPMESNYDSLRDIAVDGERLEPLGALVDDYNEPLPEDEE